MWTGLIPAYGDHISGVSVFKGRGCFLTLEPEVPETKNPGLAILQQIIKVSFASGKGRLLPL